MPNLIRTLATTVKSIGRSLIDLTNEYKNYVVLTPPILEHQIVFWKRDRRFFTYHIRSFTDYQVLAQIFRSDDYNLDKGRGKEILAAYEKTLASGLTPLVIDCGANIGLSTSYFAQQLPRARIVAVEPDIGNLNEALLNCQSPLVHYLHAGIASDCGYGNLIDPDEGSWGYRTELSDAGSLKMVSVAQIIEENSDAVPLIIKIDIEGFESELFSKNTAWVDRFPLLIVELHDWMLPGSASSNGVLKAIAASGRDFVLRGENVFSYANPIT